AGSSLSTADLSRHNRTKAEGERAGVRGFGRPKRELFRAVLTSTAGKSQGASGEKFAASIRESSVGGNLTLKHVSRNNLKDLTVRFPLGRLVLVTGVSGSGKSTLIRECLLPALTDALKSRKHQNAPAVFVQGPGR